MDSHFCINEHASQVGVISVPSAQQMTRNQNRAQESLRSRVDRGYRVFSEGPTTNNAAY